MKLKDNEVLLNKAEVIESFDPGDYSKSTYALQLKSGIISEVVVTQCWTYDFRFQSTIFQNGMKIAEFEEAKNTPPHVFLNKLGYTVIGLVDFAAIAPEPDRVSKSIKENIR